MATRWYNVCMQGVCTVSAALKGPEHYDNIIIYSSHNVEGTEPKVIEPGKLGPACFSENVVNLSDTEERKYSACLLFRRMRFKTHIDLTSKRLTNWALTNWE